MSNIIPFPSTPSERMTIKKVKRFTFADPKMIDLIRMTERIHKEAPQVTFDAIHTTVRAHFMGLGKEAGKETGKEERSAWKFRDKIRDILNDIKRHENSIKEREERINTGASKLGILYAESTLKQIKSDLKGYQQYLDEYKQKLNQYTEEEIREAIEKEKEDKAAKDDEERNQYIEDKARNYSREMIMRFIKRHEGNIKRYTARL